MDGAGHLATGYRGTVHFTASHPSTTLPVDYTFTADDLGAHAFSFTVTKAGSQSLTATDTVDSTLVGEGIVTCVAGPAAAFAISHLGAVLPPQVPAAFDVAAVDAYMNAVTGYGGRAVVTSSDPAALLPSNVELTAGLATGVPLTFMTPGAQTVTVTDAIAPSITGTATTTVAVARVGHLYVVAHQDDDLLFVNPELEASIRSGHPTRVVFVTAAGWRPRSGRRASTASTGRT